MLHRLCCFKHLSLSLIHTPVCLQWRACKWCGCIRDMVFEFFALGILHIGKLLLWNAWQVLQLTHHNHHDCCCAVCLQLIIPAQYMYTCDFHFIEKRPSYRWLYCNTRLQITIHRSLAVVLFLLLKNVAYKNSLQLFTDRNNKVSWKPG